MFGNEVNTLTKAIFRYLAANHPRWLCRLKMIRNHTIETDHRFWELYALCLKNNRAAQPFEDFFNIYQLTQLSSKLEGDIAEFGVFRGGTANLIAFLKGSRQLHLFDTFEGMPEVDPKVDHHRAGDFNQTSLESVKRYLSEHQGISYHVGTFPASANELSKTQTKFSLVHLDVDIYSSTKAGLEFFYPRVVKGGFILSHDYRNTGCPGVKLAFEEFFADKPETVLGLWKTQCLVIKQ